MTARVIWDEKEVVSDRRLYWKRGSSGGIHRSQGTVCTRYCSRTWRGEVEVRSARLALFNRPTVQVVGRGLAVLVRALGLVRSVVRSSGPLRPCQE